MKLNAFLEFPVHVFEPIFRPLRPVLLEKAYHQDLRDHYYVQQLSHFWHETTTQRNADAHCTGRRERVRGGHDATMRGAASRSR